MRQIRFLTTAIAIALILIMGNTHAQTAFHKRALLLNITEGGTKADYSTHGINGNDATYHCHIHGARDPLMAEFGLSKHFGIGLTMGSDIYNIQPTAFYGYNLPGNTVKSTSSDFTVDADYHLYVTKRTDISVCAGFGGYSVTMKGNSSDYSYNYTANGNIVRIGTRARYYFFKRLGVFGMYSAFSGHASPKGVKTNTFGQNYATAISGTTLEFGLCVRLF